MAIEHVHTAVTQDGTAVVLETLRQRVVVDSRGAALRSWSVAGREILSSDPPGDPARPFDGATLVPWPNRIRDGRYRYGGRTHQLPITEPGRSTALHGLAVDVPWELVGSEGSARFRRAVGPVEGYPFEIVVEVGFALDADGPVAELTAVNHGDESAPFGAGAHPYVRLPAGAERAALEVPAATFVPVDARRLPLAGPVAVDGTPMDFRAARAPGPREIDTCFGDLRRDADGIARVRIRPTGDDAPVTLWCDAGFAFVHVFLAPEDGALAIEPSTCAPDAFNTGVGLLSIAPGGRFGARWGLSAAE